MDQAVTPADWGDKPAAAAAPVDPASWGDKPTTTQPAKGFLASLSEGGIEGMLKESLPGMMATRLRDARDAEAKFQKGDEWNKERQRRVAAGESLNGMEQWK